MNAQDIISEFKEIDNKQKYQKLIDYGKKLDILSEDEKREEFLIRSCQSKTWLVPVINDNLSFKAYSESFIVRGVLFIIINIFNSNKINEFEDLGIYDILSDNRILGIKEILDKIKYYMKENK
jgi:cysteine desulfuration protein SufE